MTGQEILAVIVVWELFKYIIKDFYYNYIK